MLKKRMIIIYGTYSNSKHFFQIFKFYIWGAFYIWVQMKDFQRRKKYTTVKQGCLSKILSNEILNLPLPPFKGTSMKPIRIFQTRKIISYRKSYDLFKLGQFHRKM